MYAGVVPPGSWLATEYGDANEMGLALAVNGGDHSKWVESKFSSNANWVYLKRDPVHVTDLGDSKNLGEES